MIEIIVENLEEGNKSKDIANMYALTSKALKAISGSKKQTEIIKQLNDVRKKLGMPPLKTTDIKEPKRHIGGGKFAYKEDTSTASVDMNTSGRPLKMKKRKCETFSVSDDCFHRFRHGKTKFERWSKYLDMTAASQKKIYDWAKRHHNGTIILKNSTTGAVRGIRYNRTGGGQWGKITRVKEQVLKTNQEFKVK